MIGTYGGAASAVEIEEYTDMVWEDNPDGGRRGRGNLLYAHDKGRGFPEGIRPIFVSAIDSFIEPVVGSVVDMKNIHGEAIVPPSIFTGIGSIHTRPHKSEDGSYGYEACLNGEWGLYALGTTETEAIGNVVRDHTARTVVS